MALVICMWCFNHWKEAFNAKFETDQLEILEIGSIERALMWLNLTNSNNITISMYPWHQTLIFPLEKNNQSPAIFFQFICMDHHCIIYSKTHCDLLSAQTRYLITVFGGLLERTIFDLLLCMVHISNCIGANLKNYMRSGKVF